MGSSESIFIILNSTEMNSSPGEMESREVELGSRSWMDCLAAELFSNCCFSDTVSLCRCSAQPLKKQLAEYTSVFPPAVTASLTLLFWRWLPDDLFAVYWSERTDGLLIGTPPPHHHHHPYRPLPFPVPSPSLITSHTVCADVNTMTTELN